MRKSYAVLALTGFLSACGGGSTAPSSSTTPIPPATPLAASSTVVAFMGDSITQYWSGGAPAYPTIPITTLVPGAIDAGIAGETTEQMRQRFASDVLSKDPDIVVILGGTNDLRLEENPSIDSIASMAASAATAGVHVVIGTVPPSELWLGSTFLTQAETGPAIERFNAQLLRLAAAQGYAVADYWSAMLSADGSTNENLFLSDGIHPNADGYDVMWSVLRPVLVDVGVQ
jgi:lysophospholipase L1-like esterase